MKLLRALSSTLCLLLALCSTAHAKVERVIEKNFAVAPGGTLHVETMGGLVRIESSNDAGVKITAREKIRADSEAEADELLQKLTLVMEANGNDVTASARYEKSTSMFRWGGNQPVQVDFIVTVPRRFALDLKTSGGDISVGDLDGKVHAHTSGGNVRLGKITGEIDADTSGGNVELAQGMADTKLSTSGGNISVGHAAGPLQADTSGGNIKVTEIASTLAAKTSGGDVSAGFVGGLRGDSSLSTSGGRVKATVDSGASFQLEASTSGGTVKADGLTITINKGGAGKSRLNGAVNGGGPLLRLHSSGGDIVIARR